jgi:hypothetical protein
VIDRLFPRIIDNQYRGARAALWMLGVIVLLKGLMGANSFLNGRHVAMRADGIALDTFTPAGADAVVAFLGLWGLSLLLLSLLGVLALVRYRAMVPLVFLLLLTEHVGRKLILLALPVAQTGPSPAFSINAIFLVATIVGLVLSIRPSNEQPGASS